MESGVRPEPELLPAFFANPAWHPDGEWIAVEHADSVDTDGDGSFDQKFGGIWLVHSETGERQPLISGFGNPAWSPNGRKLALERRGQIFTVEVMSLQPARIDSSSLRQLTTEGRNFFPAWSPDGEWIAYDNTVCGGGTDPVPTPNSCGVLIMDKDGQNMRLISRYSRMPSWHPAELKVIFRNRAVLEGGDVIGDTLWTYDIQLNIRKLIIFLTEPNYNNHFPKYSPDGAKIAFYSQPRTGPQAAIWMMNSDGSNLRKVSPDYAWSFDWSPDGKKLVFVFWDGYHERRGNGQLWLMNVDGSGLRQLTHFQR